MTYERSNWLERPHNSSCSPPASTEHTVNGLVYSSLEKGPVCVVGLSFPLLET